MAKLDSTTFKELIDFLTPFMLNELDRQAILQSAFTNTPMVLRRLQFGGAADTFTTLLVSSLLDYGEVIPGKPAVVALLEALRPRGGSDQNAALDQLLGKLGVQPVAPPPTVHIPDAARHGRPAQSRLEPPTLRTYYEKSWALVIGINDYGARQNPLFNAANDAQGMAQTLTRHGFGEVHTLYDSQATQHAIMTWLRNELPRRTQRNDRVVIFFAGHGVTQSGPQGGKRGYLIPHDGRSYADYIDMAELQRVCAMVSAKHILFLLDCCFSGVAAIAARSTPEPPPMLINDAFLARMTSLGAWQILTAGATDEPTADSGAQPGHSAFTSALLAGLAGGADFNQDRLITATDLAAFVKPQVTRETAVTNRRGQTPFFNYLAGSELGDFVFVVPEH